MDTFDDDDDEQQQQQQQQQKREPSLWITGNINMSKQMHKWPQGFYNYDAYYYATT